MDKKKYYKYGLRPVFTEEKSKGIIRVYAFQWDTGEFKEDMTYFSKISFDFSGDKEDLSELEFDDYVKKLKSEITN